MKLTKEQIKQQLIQDIEKAGGSLQELETFLTMSKQADAEWLTGMLPGALTTALGGAKLTGSLALLAGGLGGLGLYGGYKQIQDSADRMTAKDVERMQYTQAIKELEAAIKEKQNTGMR